MRRILDGGERVAWGAKTIPEGGFLSLPRRLSAPGMLICGDGAGLVNVPALKGIHYAVESGRLAAEAAWRTLERGASARAALATYDDSIRASFIWDDLREVRPEGVAYVMTVFARHYLGVETAKTAAIPVSPSRLLRDQADAIREIQGIICDEEQIEKTA